MHAYRVSHPRGYGSVRQARRGLLAFAEQCGFHEPTLWDIESAAGEALANAAEHGDHEASAGFDVSASFDGERLVIEVKDHGAGFDCSTAFANDIPDCAGHRGFGIYLMRKLMDEVVYSEHGSCIQLVKRLDERPLTSSR
jgi:anti-sigma regulatory factor (Ser/Thr protein kinase)